MPVQDKKRYLFTETPGSRTFHLQGVRSVWAPQLVCLPPLFHSGRLSRCRMKLFLDRLERIV